MKVAVTGASGLLGTHLTRSLRTDRHEVLRLVRRQPGAPDEVRWDPRSGEVDLAGLAGVDAIIHLAGAGLGDKPWTPAHKREVYDSRVIGTRTIATAMTRLESMPRVLLSSSGVGYYGNPDPGDQVLDEGSPTGDTYIARLAHAWEGPTSIAAEAGIRVVPMRTGVVVSPKGGAFGKLLPLFRLGLGGRIGSGRQYWSWIGLGDYVRATRFLLDRDDLAGPVNVTSPHPVTNADLTASLARAVRRPAIMSVPGFALRLPLRDFAVDLLGGQRVVPRRLLDAGFEFAEPDIDTAITTAVAGQPRATSSTRHWSPSRTTVTDHSTSPRPGRVASTSPSEPTMS